MILYTSITGHLVVSVFIAILTQKARQVQGLRCMDCTNVELDASAEGYLVNPILTFIPGIRNKHCVEPTDEHDIDLITCPPNPDSGDLVYRCGAYNGKINIAMFSGISNSSLRVIDRQCVLIYQGLRYGCHPQTFVEDYASDLQKILKSLENLGAVDFQGNICLSEDIDSTSSSSRVVFSLMLLMCSYFLCLLLS
ncbi:uncharacterized protein LOC110443608 [Mizuhopecten yessoensis]|uniref:Uncharacterized protein n=1 Tax=Mizuhopecten yessoensis TaxID=6573 RepID=A0A210PEI3_MIZYE|nr:uncharacterized protein LOC110443608 [Mizuhopecten yessoensis]OWF34902.1 hypothetical protein KP79_PYT08692 [Mizuhopecten yessoensis]